MKKTLVTVLALVIFMLPAATHAQSTLTQQQLIAQIQVLLDLITSLQQQLAQQTGSVPSLTVTPTSGGLPFTVAATVRNNAGTQLCGPSSMGKINWGDGIIDPLAREISTSDCADGATDTIQHTYTREGTFMIIFTATDGRTAVQTVTARGQTVMSVSSLSISVPDTVGLGKTFQFSFISNDTVLMRDIYAKKDLFGNYHFTYRLIPVSDPTQVELSKYGLSDSVWGEEQVNAEAPVVANAVLTTVGYYAQISIKPGTYKIRVAVTKPMTVSSGVASNYQEVAFGESDVFTIR